MKTDDRGTFRAPRRGVLILVLLSALAVSCDTAGPSAGAGASLAAEPSTGTPAVEGTGPESPAPRRKKVPSVKTAGAPAGEGGWSDNDDGSLCLGVRWLGGQDGADLRAGITFRVTEVRLTGATAAGSACREPCVGFVFDVDSQKCRQAVQPGATEGTLALYGRVRCSAPAPECEQFRSNLRRRTIPIPARETNGEDPDETGEPGSSEPAAPAG